MSGNTRKSWKYDDQHCVHGEVESEEHMLLYCHLYMDMRRRWKDFFITGYEARIIVLKGKLSGIYV